LRQVKREEERANEKDTKKKATDSIQASKGGDNTEKQGRERGACIAAEVHPLDPAVAKIWLSHHPWWQAVRHRQVPFFGF
jgi:hypothetical protein